MWGARGEWRTVILHNCRTALLNMEVVAVLTPIHAGVACIAATATEARAASLWQHCCAGCVPRVQPCRRVYHMTCKACALPHLHGIPVCVFALPGIQPAQLAVHTYVHGTKCSQHGSTARSKTTGRYGNTTPAALWAATKARPVAEPGEHTGLVHTHSSFKLVMLLQAGGSVPVR
jgi:hypothetical protein